MPAVYHLTPPLYVQRPKAFSKKSRSYLELAYLLVQLGNEAGVVFLFVVLVTTEDAGGALSQGILPFANLAGVNLKSIGQLGYRPFTLMGCVSFGSVSCSPPICLSYFRSRTRS